VSDNRQNTPQGMPQNVGLIRCEDIERTVSKLTGMPLTAIRQSRTANPGD